MMLSLKFTVRPAQKRAHSYACVLGLYAGLAATMALAASGDLDLSFNGTGKVTTAVGIGGAEGRSVAVQPDGKILLGGDTYTASSKVFALARYLPGGSLDPSFAGGGTVLTDLQPGDDQGFAVAVQDDGRILLGGTAVDGDEHDFGLVRYLADGTLDATFGSGGKVITPIGAAWDAAFGVAVQADGKIVLCGQADVGSQTRLALARYLSNGSLDGTFGSGGKVITSIQGIYDLARGVTVQPDGKIVVAGYSFNGSRYSFALARYLQNGTLDPTFDGDGKVTTAVTAGHSQATAVRLQPDGRIVASGDSSGRFALARYLADGSLDNSLDGDGLLTTAIGPGSDTAQSLALQVNGKILLGGSSRNADNKQTFALARYESNGDLDSGFGTSGVVTTVFGPFSDALGRSVALQGDGKILLGGRENGFALARYDGDAVVDLQAPVCSNAGVVSEPGRVYLRLGLTDDVSGVRRARLTANATNCHLEYPLGNPLSADTTLFPLGTRTSMVYAVKNNPSLTARVELFLTDHSGKQTLFDPVIANLTVKNGNAPLVRVFNGIPQAERYVTLQNGTPGLTSATLTVNGRVVSQGGLTDGQVVTLDVARWLRPGSRNVVRVAARGPRGATALFTISDQAAGAGASAAAGAAVNLEFAR